MAHRIYVFNVDSKTKEEYPYYLGEWNYEIPSLLLPLFSGNPRSKGKILYFDKEEGVSRLRMFYQFIGEHYQLTYKKVYYEPVNKMFEILESLPYDTLVMDATDVFNMNEESHTNQAKDWILEIKEKNKAYQKAVKNQNITSLEKNILAGSGYESILTLLETDWIGYGLGYWNENLYKNPSEIFEEGGLWGLKNPKGALLAPAVYEEIFLFNDDGIAVAQKNGRFGYLKNDGRVIVEFMYDDALDALLIGGNNYGIVYTDNKAGLLDIRTGKTVFPYVYDELELLRHTGLFNAKKDDHYRVINLSQQQLIADLSETPFQFDYNNLIYRKQEGSSKRKYYTLEGIYLGDYPEEVLSHISDGYYRVQPNKFQRKNSIIQPDGNLLDSEIDTVMLLGDYRYTSFAYRKDGRWYIYDAEHAQFRLSTHTISHIHRDWYTQFMTNVFLVSDENGWGIYQASEDRWLLPPSREYKKIESCKHEIFRISVDEGMFYYDQKADVQSEVYDYICEGIEYNEQLLCLFKGNEMLILTEERKLHQVSYNQMGALYEKRYNLRGKDHQYFLNFYNKWTEKAGSGYEVYFDSDTLRSQAEEYSREGKIIDAVRLYTIGADRGDADMMVDLGYMYTDAGLPELYDLPKGLSLYEKAAAKDQPYAWNNLGYHHQNGIGYPQNIKKALQCFKKAADLGNGLAMQNLGLLYFYGDDILQDYDKALDYYKMAEKQFLFNDDKMAEIYYQKRDYPNLLRYLKKDDENIFSHIYYGILYDEGFGVKSSAKKAILHYEKALGYSIYDHALKRLLYFYKEHPDFADPEKYKYWKAYGEENDMDF